MDNLLEIILPLIFFAVYFASQFFGKKGDEDSQEEQPEAMRKVREELRKKIEERRRAQEGQQQQQTREPETQERAGGAVLRESRQRPEREQAPNPPKEPSQAPAPSFPNARNYDTDLEERMAEVQRSQEKVEAARRQARERIGSLAANKAKSSNSTRSRTESYRQFLRDSLRDPENLRKSFLLHEVFGTPVGMRDGGKMRPSWDL